MFRSPISKTGKLRYGELFKYALLFVVFITFISAKMNNETNLLIHMSYVVGIIAQSIFLIQISFMVLTAMKEIQMWIESFEVKGISIPRIQNQFTTYKTIMNPKEIVSKHSLQNMYCIIRC